MFPAVPLHALSGSVLLFAGAATEQICRLRWFLPVCTEVSEVKAVLFYEKIVF